MIYVESVQSDFVPSHNLRRLKNVLGIYHNNRNFKESACRYRTVSWDSEKQQKPTFPGLMFAINSRALPNFSSF